MKRYGLSCSSCPRIDHDLGDVFFLVAPDFVHLWRLIERDAMGNDVAGIDLALFDSLQQRLHVVVHVGLPHLHGDALAERSAEGHFVEQAAVHSGDRERCRPCAPLESPGEERLADPFRASKRLYRVISPLQISGVRFQTHSVDASIGTDSAGQIFERREHADVLFGVVDRDRSQASRQFEPFRKSINRDDPAGAEHECTRNGKLTDRTATPNGDRVPS